MDDADEFAAYDAVLGAKYSAERPERFVIASETTSLKESAFIGLWHGRAHVKAQRPEVDAPTSSDFDIKNEATMLTNRFSVSVPYVLVAWMNCGKFFAKAGRANRTWPGGVAFAESIQAARNFAFSRVGFNENNDQALLYAENQGDFPRRGRLRGRLLYAFLDAFLQFQVEKAQAQAIKEVVAWQLAKAMKKRKISKNRMATLMKTSRTQVDCLLNANDDITLSSLQRAAAIVGRRVIIELV